MLEMPFIAQRKALPPRPTATSLHKSKQGRQKQWDRNSSRFAIIFSSLGKSPFFGRFFFAIAAFLVRAVNWIPHPLRFPFISYRHIIQCDGIDLKVHSCFHNAVSVRRQRRPTSLSCLHLFSRRCFISRYFLNTQYPRVSSSHVDANMYEIM